MFFWAFGDIVCCILSLEFIKFALSRLGKTGGPSLLSTKQSHLTWSFVGMVSWVIAIQFSEELLSIPGAHVIRLATFLEADSGEF